MAWRTWGQCFRPRYRNYSSTLKTGNQVEETITTLNNENEPSKSFLRSSLFIPGDKAHLAAAVFKPDVDFDRTLVSIEKLSENLTARGIPRPNLKYLIDGWKKLQNLREENETLQSARTENRAKIVKLGDSDKSLFEDLRIKGKKLRDEQDEIKKLIWELEDELVIPLLSLPNRLHPNTPVDGSDKILTQYSSPPQFSFKPVSHSEIGNENENQIHFSNVSPNAYFLRGPAAIFEMKTTRYFSRKMRRANFQQTINPDFCKPPIAEACGKGFLNPNYTFMLKPEDEKSPLPGLLTGGASLMAYAAFHAKKSFEKNFNLPLRYYTIGRHYRPLTKSPSPSLFNTSQSTQVQFFSMVENDSGKTDQEYSHIVQFLTDLYKKIGLHFRIVNKSANELEFTEALRTVVQMWAPSLEKYVDIANVSICDDYVSGRLMTRYKCDDGSFKNFNTVHGVALHVPSYLACVMENTQMKSGWTIPQEFV